MQEAPPAGTKVYSRSVYVYDGKDIDQGQVFELHGCPNDEVCNRLGYWEVLPRNKKTMQCGVCGEKFIDGRTLGFHGDKRHPERFAEEAPLEEDRREAEQERLMQESPLRLDRTAATLEA